MFVVVFVLYDDGVSSKRNFSSLPLNPWRGKKIKWKTEFIIQYSQQFWILKDIGVSKVYTHKMYSKVFAIPSKYFIWKVLTTLGFIWWKSKKKKMKASKCYLDMLYFVYSSYVSVYFHFTLRFVVWFLFLEKKTSESLLIFVLISFYMPLVQVYYFLFCCLISSNEFEIAKIKQEIQMCWIILENVSIFLTESKLNCWIELRYKIDYKCFVSNKKDQSILCYANIMFWLCRISEKI